MDLSNCLCLDIILSIILIALVLYRVTLVSVNDNVPTYLHRYLKKIIYAYCIFSQFVVPIMWHILLHFSFILIYNNQHSMYYHSGGEGTRGGRRGVTAPPKCSVSSLAPQSFGN